MSRNLKTAFYGSLLLEERRVFKLDILFVLFVSLILGLFVYWASITKVEETVAATGIVKFQRKTVSIQHNLGGTIQTLYVKNGQKVEIGTPLLDFDGTKIDNDLANFSETMKTLRNRLYIMQKLYKHKKGLVHEGLATKVSLLEHEQQLSDIKRQIMETKSATKGLSNLRNKLRVTAQIPGIVHDIKLEQGNVISPGVAFMKITPGDGILQGEVDINAKDIGLINVGQDAHSTFTSFDFSRYGSISGKLASLAPTSIKDESGKIFYRGIITFNSSTFGQGKQAEKIRSGMTMTSEVKTGEKTVLQYLLKPIYSSTRRSLNER